jgi:hypothetical protein
VARAVDCPTCGAPLAGKPSAAMQFVATLLML